MGAGSGSEKAQKEVPFEAQIFFWHFSIDLSANSPKCMLNYAILSLIFGKNSSNFHDWCLSQVTCRKCVFTGILAWHKLSFYYVAHQIQRYQMGTAGLHRKYLFWIIDNKLKLGYTLLYKRRNLRLVSASKVA